MGNYVFSKKKPEIGDKGFIIEDRFIPINKSEFDWVNPPITSYEQDGYKITKSAVFAGYQGWYLFDYRSRFEDGHDDTGDGWVVYTYQLPAWVMIECSYSVKLTSTFLITRYEGNGRCPKDIKIQGSNDGTNFDDLLNTQLPYQPNTKFSFDIVNNKYYKFYRYYVTSSWDSSFTGLAEWRLIGKSKIKL